MWPRPPLMSQPTDAPHFPLNCCLIMNTPKKEIHLLLRLHENLLFGNFVVVGRASLIVNTRARAHTHAQMATIKGGDALIWICVQSSQASPRLLITLRLPAGAFRSSCWFPPESGARPRRTSAPTCSHANVITRS